jgi:hypothetical protein
VRDRRSPGAARLQLKWLVSATAAVVIVYALVVSVSVYAEGQTPLGLMVLQDAATFQAAADAHPGRRPPLLPPPRGRGAGRVGLHEPSAGQIDLEALNRELLGIIDHTVQPSHASLWLRD